MPAEAVGATARKPSVTTVISARAKWGMHDIRHPCQDVPESGQGVDAPGSLRHTGACGGHAKKQGVRFGIGEDDAGRIIACPEESLPRDVLRVCSAATPKSAGRQGTEREIESYSSCGLSYADERLQVDDAASGVLGHLEYGIAENGPLLDMTMGLEQLSAALESTSRIQKRRGGRLICDIKRSRRDKHYEHVVAIAQMSKRPEFVEPLAAVISDDGVSMLNRPQHAARLRPGSRSGDPDNKAWRDMTMRITDRIYHGGWRFATLLYGVLETGRIGTKVLQDEMADMATICRARVRDESDTIRISVNRYGHLLCAYWPDRGRAADTASITIDSKSLWDGDRISKGAVAKSAQYVVRKFSRLQPFMPCPYEPVGYPSFPGPEENYPSPPAPPPGGPATLPIVRHDLPSVEMRW